MTVIINGTTGIVGATWTTAGRPSSPAVGQRGFNTTINGAEIYNGAQWNPISNGFSASGGTITRVGGYTIHTFLSSGTFTPDFAGEVEYLVVAGGGGGGGYCGAGGGAGGFRTATNFAVAATGLTVTVGAGGAGGNGVAVSGSQGTNSVFSTITSVGGGYGAHGTSAVAGGVGGSGGGATTTTTAAGTAGQGNSGGAGTVASSQGGGGGGGASATGGTGVAAAGGDGGAGAYSNYSGSIVPYAGGGGGGNGGSKSIGGAGGVGGGGTGTGASSAVNAGTANTGGGGGGAGYPTTYPAGAGGSGIVIIRYPTAGTVILPIVGTVGTVASVNMLQTRTQGDFVAYPTGNGTIVTPLNITFTPKKAGNKVILEFTVNGEGSHEVGWIVTRNNVNLPDTTDGSNNMWAVTTAGSYDNDISTTPNTRVVRILDLNTLAGASTYKVLVRCTYTAQTNTYRLNRAHGSAGGDYAESLLSVVTATEIWT